MQIILFYSIQMNASNLAVCFAPSLFNTLGNLNSSSSPRRQRKSPGMPEQRELLEQKGTHGCFTYMITDCKKLFMVSFLRTVEENVCTVVVKSQSTVMTSM